MSEAEHTRELSRLLSAHRSALFSSRHWDELLEAPSKIGVDHVLGTFTCDVGDIHPRTYETFLDLEIRDAICEWIGRPYGELPDSGPAKRDIGFEIACWWWGAIGALFVMSFTWEFLVKPLLGRQ